MIFWALIAVGGFAGGYFFAAGYGGKLASGIGALVKQGQLDALGLGDDESDNPTDSNGSSAGSP